jgi:hypothetical protein
LERHLRCGGCSRHRARRGSCSGAGSPAVEIAGPPTGDFNPVLDPRCRTVPRPEIKSLWRHGAFSPNRGLPVARPLYGFRPISVTPQQSHRTLVSWLPWLPWLPCSLGSSLLTKHHPRPRPAGVHEPGSTFGSRNRPPPHWLLPSCGARCLRPFPAAVRRPFSPIHLARTTFRTGRPSPKSGRSCPREEGGPKEAFSRR